MAGITIPVQADTQQAESSFASLGSSMGGMAVIGAAAFAAVAAAAVAAAAAIFKAASDTAALGDEFDKMAGRTGVSVETLSALAFAADLAGTDIRTLEKALKTGAKSLFEAERGTKTYKDALDALGISATDAGGNLIDVEDLLFQVADAFQGMTSDTEKAALAQQIFGGRATALIPLLNQGSDAIRAQMEEAKKLGVVWTTLASKEAAAFVDAQARVSASLQGLANAFGQQVVPVLTKGLNELAELIARQGDTFVRLGQIVVQVMGSIVTAVGKAIPFMGAVVANAELAWLLLTKSILSTKLMLARASLAIEDASSAFLNNDQVITDLEQTINTLGFAMFENELAMRDSAQTAGDMEDAAAVLGAEIEELGRGLSNMASGSLPDAEGATEDFTEEIKESGVEADIATVKIQGYNRELTGIPQAAQVAEQAIEDFSDALANMPISIPEPGDLFGGFVSEIVSFMETDAGRDIGNGLSVGIGAALSGGSAVDALVAGMTAGLTAMVNAIIPGLGTLIGPLLNALRSLIENVFGKASVGEDLGRDLGISISAGLTQSIEGTADDLGDIFAAITFRLGDIMREVGINSAAMLQVFARRTRDLFSAIEQGILSASDVTSVINDQFLQLLEANEMFGDVASGQLAELIELAQRFGVTIDQSLIDRFNNVTDAIQTMVDVYTAGLEALGIAQERSVAEITADQIKAIKALGLSAETEAALIKGLRQEMRADQKAADKEFIQGIKERAKELGLDRDQTRELIRETRRVQRTEERQAEREKRADFKETEDAAVASARSARDRIRQVFKNEAISVPIEAIFTGSTRALDSLVAAIMRRLETAGGI